MYEVMNNHIMNKLLKVRNININMCMYNNRRKVSCLKIAKLNNPILKKPKPIVFNRHEKAVENYKHNRNVESTVKNALRSLYIVQTVS